MGFLNKIFIIITFNLIACKNQIQEPIVLPSIYMESTISVPKDTTNKEVEVLKVVKIPDEKNKIIDSVVFYSLYKFERNIVDSFCIYFIDKKQQKIYIKRDLDGFNEFDFLLPSINDRIFRDFNPDYFIDIVLKPAFNAPAQISWSVVYLFNNQDKSFEIANHLTRDGLEYCVRNQEYVQKMKNGLGRYSLNRYRLFKNKQNKLFKYESYYINHDYSDKNYNKKFFIEYQNFETKLVYRDTCRVKITNCKINYISCNKSIFKKFRQTWIDFYEFQKGIVDCPEMEL